MVNLIKRIPDDTYVLDPSYTKVQPNFKARPVSLKPRSPRMPLTGELLIKNTNGTPKTSKLIFIATKKLFFVVIKN